MVKTFEEWYGSIRTRESSGAEAHLAAAAWNAGYMAGQFALNNELGVAANEAAKAERCEKAVQAVIDQFAVCGKRPEIRAIIKEAQG